MKNRKTDESLLKDIFKTYVSREDTFSIVYNSITEAHGNELSEKEAFEMATEFIDEVRSICSNTGQMDNDDAQAVLDDYFDCLKEALNDEERLYFLHKLRFGLGFYTSDEMVKQYENNKSQSELFDEYYEESCKNPYITENYLKHEIKNILTNYCISPYFLKKLTEGLTDENVIEASAFTLEKAERLLCIIAAKVYCKNGGIISFNDVISGVLSNKNELNRITYASDKGVLSREWGLKLQRGIFFSGIVLAVFAAAGVAAMIESFQVISAVAVFFAVAYGACKLAVATKKYIGEKTLMIEYDEKDAEKESFIIRKLKEVVVAGDALFAAYEEEDDDEDEDEEETL